MIGRLLLLGALLSPLSGWALDAQPLKVYRDGTINFVAGGMSDEELKELGILEEKYPVKLMFSIHGDKTPLKGVRIQVLNVAQDALVDVMLPGPIFMVNPPSGRYTFQAEYKGEILTRTFDLTGRRYLGWQFEFGAGKK